MRLFHLTILLSCALVLPMGCSSPEVKTGDTAAAQTVDPEGARFEDESNATFAQPPVPVPIAEAPPIPPPVEEKSPVEVEVLKQSDPLYEKAAIFDKYLNGNLDLEDAQALIKGCHSNPSDSIFCFSVTNYDLLEERLKKGPPTTPSPPASKSTRYSARPRFRRGKLLNWNELKGAPVTALLRGLASLSPAEARKIKDRAVKERRCPNNAAIAVAANLEEMLPDRVDFLEVARLFEKGADCMTQNPADRENLLTRAGLFYYAKKHYKTAAKVFWRAANTDTFVSRPLYWLYRTRVQLKEKRRAELTLEILKKRYPFSFHALVALTATNLDPGEILSRTQPVAIRRSQREPTVNMLIEQVEVLHRLGFESSASRVLDWAINDFVDVEPELKVYLAELKKEQGDYQSKITLLSEILYKHPTLISRRTMELYFPKVLFPLFEQNSSGLDPYLLLAIARRESAFNASAISSAKARGLMQVLPITGRKIDPDSDLLDPRDNVSVGSRYVLELLKRLDGQIHFALAAYNAGPHKLTAWTRRYEAVLSDPILFIDLIPYRETREYVASVLRNYYWYRRIHQGDTKITTQRLLDVALPPKGSTQ